MKGKMKHMTSLNTRKPDTIHPRPKENPLFLFIPMFSPKLVKDAELDVKAPKSGCNSNVGERFDRLLMVRDQTDEVVLFFVGLQKGLCTMQSSTAALDVSAVTLICWHVIIPRSGPEYFTVLPRAPLIGYDLIMM